MSWDIVIGLEIHVQLSTQSKIFSGSSTHFGSAPNTQANEVDLGLPGVLPVLNKETLHLALMFGEAIAATPPEFCAFDRKNYFYPDLPKGYQTTQMDYPIVTAGTLTIETDGAPKSIRIHHAHLEEDAGKSLHEDFQGMTGIDLNRAGTPLLEIVSEPDMRSAAEAVAALKKIHSIVRYLGISDGNMAEGSMRCDVNVSIMPKGSDVFGTRVEIKNVNSFKFVEKAIHTEVERQMDVLECGGELTQETRLYDPESDETRSMRSKEEANDYRYFPCPDLLHVPVTADMVNKAKEAMPELPDEKIKRYTETLGLSPYDASVLASDPHTAAYFDQCLLSLPEQPKLISNWVTGTLAGYLNKENLGFDAAPVNPDMLAQLLNRITDNTISGNIAKKVFQTMCTTGETADAIIEKEGLKQVTDTGAIEALIDEVIANNPNQVEQYQSGKTKIIGFLVGQVMKASKGKANPAQVNALLSEKLRS